MSHLEPAVPSLVTVCLPISIGYHKLIHWVHKTVDRPMRSNILLNIKMRLFLSQASCSRCFPESGGMKTVARKQK